MATSFALTGRTVVRLSHVPAELRLQVAHELARSWGLRGMDYALWMLRANRPTQDPLLFVDPEKAEAVLSGQRPRGTSPKFEPPKDLQHD